MRNPFRRLTDNGPTREGFYYLCVFGFVLGGAVLREINLLLLFAGLLAAPLAWNGFIARRTLGKLTIRRQSPEMISLGDELFVTIQVAADSPAGAARWLVAKESLRKESKRNRSVALAVEVDLPIATGVKSSRGTYQGIPTNRGRYVFEPLRLSTTYPWGLLRRTRIVSVPGEVLVAPRLGRLSERWLRREQRAGRGGEKSQTRRGGEGDFFGLRDWSPGDSRRSVHWRTTARKGHLMVRQFEQPNTLDTLLLLDLWLPDRPTAEQRAEVEQAVSFAATVWSDRCRRGVGSRLVLGIAGQELQISQGTASQRTLMEAWELLATCEPTKENRIGDLRALMIGQHVPTTANCLLVSTRPIPASEKQDANGAENFSDDGEISTLYVESDEFRAIFAS